MFVKKSRGKKIRNILESPFQVSWSKKTIEQLLPVQDALKELLPAARIEENSSKENLIKIRKDTEENVKIKHKNIYRDFLAPGYQSVMRGLQNKELCCVAFSNNVTPPLLLKVALTCAHTSGIPAIIIPDLKTITSSALGFATMALGFKTVVAESTNNYFHTIYEMISENPTIIDSPLMCKPKENLRISDTVVDNINKSSSKINEIETANTYLYRKPNGERAFIPVHKIANVDFSASLKRNNPFDFISLGEGPKIKSTSDERKNKNIAQDNYSIDYDDSGSDEDSMFFVDNKPDESLLKVNSANSNNTSSKEKSQQFKIKKKISNFNKTVKELRISGPEYLDKTAFNITKSSEDLNVLKKKKKKKQKNSHRSMESVKYQPLHIKSVTSNLNKSKRKKTKLCKIK